MKTDASGKILRRLLFCGKDMDIVRMISIKSLLSPSFDDKMMEIRSI
jgi:hypothetical protein